MLELAARVPAVQMGVDPGLSGLLLRQRIRPIARPDRLEKGAGVRAAQMVSLAAAAVVEDFVATVGVADAFEALGDLGDRGVPVDLLVAAVGTPPHRGRQPAAVVLIVIESQRLVARVALRRRMLLVTADLGQRAALELHDDATVALAQDAGCRLPVTGHRGLPFGGFGLQQCAQLTLDEVEWFHVAGRAGDDDRALDRSRHQHRQFLRARGGDTFGRQSSADQIRPECERRRGALDDLAGAFGIVGVARLDRHRDNRTSGAIVAADQLLAVHLRQLIQQLDGAVGRRDLSRDVRPRVVGRLFKQLHPAAGKVVVGRSARRAAVLQHIGNRSRLGAAFANQLRGGNHHPLSGTARDHVIYDGIHNIRMARRGPASAQLRTV